MTIVITDKNEGKTIKDFLRKDLAFSSGLIKRLKARENGITVNGNFATVRYVLKEGDTLVLADDDRVEDTSPYIIPIDIPLGVAYEDSFVTVADKPAAMPAHPSYSHRDDTVANALAYRYRERPYVFRPVNRLDADTSGLMITANDHLSAVKLGRSMIGGAIGKMYIAILTRAPEDEYGIIDRHMKRCAESIITRRVCDPDEEKARRAVTVYKKIYTDSQSGVCVVIASPVTGRTHQLRVHFASLGCALVGDTLYGVGDDRIGRHALHAAYTSFPHPRTDVATHVFSPIPEDMRLIIGEDVAAMAEECIKNEVYGHLRELYDEMKRDIK